MHNNQPILMELFRDPATEKDKVILLSLLCLAVQPTWNLRFLVVDQVQLLLKSVTNGLHTLLTSKNYLQKK